MAELKKKESLGHRMKMMKMRYTGKAETTVDSAFHSKEDQFLQHYRNTKKLAASLQMYIESLRGFSQAAAVAASDLKKYYEDNKNLSKIAAEFYKSTETIDKEGRTPMDDVYRKKILEPLQEYLAVMKMIKDKRKERDVVLQNYDYYRQKVKALKEKPAKDTTYQERNESKLLVVQSEYKRINAELVGSFDQLLEDRYAAFNPYFVMILKQESAFYTCGTKACDPLSKIAENPSGFGVDIVTKPKFDVRDIPKYGEKIFPRSGSQFEGLDKKGRSSRGRKSVKDRPDEDAFDKNGSPRLKDDADDRSNTASPITTGAAAAAGAGAAAAAGSSAASGMVADDIFGPAVPGPAMVPQAPVAVQPSQTNAMFGDTWAASAAPAAAPAASNNNWGGWPPSGQASGAAFGTQAAAPAAQSAAAYDFFGTASQAHQSQFSQQPQHQSQFPQQQSQQQPHFDPFLGSMANMPGNRPPIPTSASMGGQQCEALFPFTAENPGELSLKKGDIVRIIKKDDSGWWEGEVNGQRGLFPGNYTRAL